MRFKTVCCVCHKVKSENNKWRFETFNADTSSHGYCEVCAEALLSKIADRKTVMNVEIRLPG